jgi:CubicO group peptidase (beta-lactamase class C family)
MKPVIPAPCSPVARFVGTLALAGLVLPSALAAQTPVDPAVADSVFAAWDRPGSPGCAVGVYRGGDVVLARGYGEANLDWAIPIEPSTVFYAGSVSKQFTAATAALLHLRGDLDLDAEVRTFVPELPPYDPDITVRQLVHHTSGVRDIYGLISLSGGNTADAWSDQAYLELIARQTDLNFPAGSDYLYSNGAYFLLTTVIERVTGKRLDDAARELIFQPLGMRDTHFHQDRERIVPRRAMSYGGSAPSGFRQTYLGNFDKAGAGGLYTTIADLAAWNRNFETGEVGGAAFLELIQAPGVLSNGQALTYAFGLQHGEDEGRRTLGHGGSFMGFQADFVRFPDEGLAVAALCNLGSLLPGPLTRRVARGVLGPVPGHVVEAGAPSGPPDAGGDSPFRPGPGASEAARVTGHWESPEVGAMWEIREVGGELRLFRAPEAPGVPLVRVGDHRFRSGNQWLDFELREGVPVSFRLDAGRVRNLRFQRTGPAG